MVAEARRELKLGDPVRFTRQMAGFRARKPSPYDYGGTDNGYVIIKTSDPTDGYRHDQVRARLKELTATEGFPGGRPGTYRIVVEWEPKPRREYDLLNKNSGIIVGKTFRYEGQVEYEEGWMTHVGPVNGGYNGNARRVPCWEVKQALNKRPVLVPLDAVELIPVCPACGERAEHFDPERGVDGEWTCVAIQYGGCRDFSAR